MQRLVDRLHARMRSASKKEMVHWYAHVHQQLGVQLWTEGKRGRIGEWNWGIEKNSKGLAEGRLIQTFRVQIQNSSCPLHTHTLIFLAQQDKLTLLGHPFWGEYLGTGLPGSSRHTRPYTGLLVMLGANTNTPISFDVKTRSEEAGRSQLWARVKPHLNK
jgi:hypothetical protein